MEVTPPPASATSRAMDARMKDLVFVLDDDDEVARLMCDALQRFDYETEQFSRGHEIRGA